MRRIQLVGGIIGAFSALGLTGCGGTAAAPDARQDGPAKLRTMWTNHRIEPAGQPVVADGSAVLYEVRGERLWLTALDAATGQVRWSEEATPSWTTPGVSLEPHLVGTEERPMVAMLAPNESGEMMADLLVLDAATGNVVERVPARHFRSTPEECPDVEAVCVRAADPETGVSVPMRLDLSTGSFTAVPSPRGWSPRSIGSHGLVENGLRAGQEAIARVRAGSVVWQKPLASIFGPGATSDNGWSFKYAEGSDVFVGSVGIPYEGTFEDRTTDLSGYRTVGLDGTTGELLWSQPATSTFCAPDIDEDDATFVRCRQAGTVHAQLGSSGDTQVSFNGLRSTLEGFDPRTGQTTWDLDMDGHDTLYASTGPRPMASRSGIALETGDGQQVVDLRTGEVRPTSDNEVFVCTEVKKFTYVDPVYYGGVPYYERVGGQIDYLCDSSGDAASGDFTEVLAAVNGEPVAGTTVLATRNGVVGLRK